MCVHVFVELDDDERWMDDGWTLRRGAGVETSRRVLPGARPGSVFPQSSLLDASMGRTSHGKK